MCVLNEPGAVVLRNFAVAPEFFKDFAERLYWRVTIGNSYLR